MSAAATLVVALRHNGLTVAELAAMSAKKSLRLGWVGPKIIREARSQARKIAKEESKK